MTDAIRDGNHVPVALGVSTADSTLTTPLTVDPATGKLQVSSSGGSGSVTSVSVATANGFSGTVANPTTTPAITLTVPATGILKSNGTAIGAATAGTDYLTPTGSGAGLTGIVTSVSNSDSTLTISPATGSSVASLNLAHANTWTAEQTITPATGTALSIGAGSGTNALTITSGSIMSTGSNNFFVFGSGTYTGVSNVLNNFNSNTGLLIQRTSTGSSDYLSIQNSTSVVQFSINTSGHITTEGVTATGATGTGNFVFSSSPSLTTPAIGAATGTSLRLTGSSATELTAGSNGVTNPAFNVDSSTASSATGLNIKSAAAAGGVAVSTLSSGTNEALTIDAKGTGIVSLATISTGGIALSKTIAGTTGAQTINKTSGQVQFAAANTSLVVTNNLVSATSIIIATVASNDATMSSVTAVAAAGSFTLRGNTTPTGTCLVNFIVTN